MTTRQFVFSLATVLSLTQVPFSHAESDQVNCSQIGGYQEYLDCLKGKNTLEQLRFQVILMDLQTVIKKLVMFRLWERWSMELWLEN
jgi:hypothetical protein